MFEVVIAGLVIMLASLSGVAFLQKTAHDFLDKRLPYLVSFSAGVFLLTAGALAFEVFEIADSFLMGVALISSGYFLAWILHYLLPETHHHHNPDCGDSHKAARKIIVGDSIHNVADGIILVGAFAVSPALGVAVTVSVFIHEALQEISEFFILKQGGYSTKKALGINFLVSSTIFIGIILGYLALASHDLEVWLLALSAGFFLHVVIHDLLPTPGRTEEGKSFLLHLLLVVVGAVIMGLVATALGDSHAHGEEHDGHTEEEMHDEVEQDGH